MYWVSVLEFVLIFWSWQRWNYRQRNRVAKGMEISIEKRKIADYSRISKQVLLERLGREYVQLISAEAMLVDGALLREQPTLCDNSSRLALSDIS